MNKLRILLGSLIGIMAIVATFLPMGNVSAAPVVSDTSLTVAIHVSEYTKAYGLSLNKVNGDYPWYYFQIYTFLEEALISDGTPFVEVSDADIAAGKLLSASGAPKYPILFSLATECISDTEVQAIRSYVSQGGFVYVGSSAWTRKQDGSYRTTFALSTEMGLQSAAVGPNNWIYVGITGSRFEKVANHRLVSQLTLNTYYQSPNSNAYTDSSSNGAHQAWVTTLAGATTLVSIENSTAPLLAIKSYGTGYFIYHAELSAAGTGYMFFRNAIEWAFQAQGLPLVRISAWPYPYQAAFYLRHDDQTVPLPALVLQEQQLNLHGQYFVVTGWCNGAAMPGGLSYATSRGAVIGSHSDNHTAPDTQTYAQVSASTNASLNQLAIWLGTRPNTYVAPYGAALTDSSMRAIADNGITVSAEQSVGALPHYALSMVTEKKHYALLEIPHTTWNNSAGTLLDSNDGTWTNTDIQNAVDFIYNLGGVIGIYDHQGSYWLGTTGNTSVLYYMTYAKTKSNLWTTTFGDIATWWATKSAVSVSSSFTTDGASRSLTITTAGASSALTALDLVMPESATVSVTLNGSPSTSFRQTGTAVKINSGTAQTVKVSWSAVNSPPVAGNDSYTTPKNTALTVAAASGVLANDTDANGDSLTAVLVTSPLHAALTLNSNGSFTYTPTTGYSGSDSFAYKAYDGKLYSNTATVSITVTAPNTAPVAVNDSYSTVKNTALTVAAASGVLANDTDADGDSLTATLVTSPTHGTLTFNSDGSFTYTPTTGYSGSDSFTYKANDGKVDSNTATVSISISNTAPVAVNDSYSTTKNTALTVAAASGVLANDTDANGDSLTAVLVTSPSHGTLTLNSNGSFTYTPTTGYSGSDSFTYKANDGKVDSNIATVSISISNTAPVAANDSYNTAKNKALTVAAAGVLTNDTDANGDSLTAVLVTSPSHGAVTLNSNGSFTYTPTTSYTGSDSFTYKANDGTADSNIATVSITITNTAPVAVNDSYSTVKNTALTVAAASGVLANDTDANGDSLTATLVTGPSHGTLTLNSNGSFTYTPTTGYTGSDSFTYKANDGTVDSNIATVSITITASNTAPVAVNDSYSTAKNTALTVASASGVLANDTDVDGDSLTAVLVTGPSHGTLTLNSNGSFTYTPTTGYTGADSFTYKANDGKADSNTATVSITITNTAPVAVNDSYNTTLNTALTVAAASGVLANDTDANGDSLTAVQVTSPSNGTLTFNSNGSFTYTPTTGYTGADSFTYKANDGQADSNIATVSITVTGASSTFGLNAGNSTYAPGEPANWLSAMRFINSAGIGSVTKLEILIDSTIVSGKVRLGVYADNSGKPGSLLLDAGEVTVTNGWVSISGLNLPVTQNTYYWLAFVYQNAIGIRYQTGQATNSHYWDALTYGALPSQFTFSSQSGYNNNQYVMRATVTLGNVAPVAANDSYGTRQNTTLTVAAASGVLANDTDANGDSLTAVLVTSPLNGTLTFNSNGSFTYTPTTGYTGTDSFTYKANDGQADSNIATVSITITASTATFGLSAGNNTYALGEDPNWLSAMRFINSAGTGNLTKLEILVDSNTVSGKIRLGVYADNNGKPGALLLDAGEVTVANGWISISGLNLPVTQNTYYWLAFVSQNTIGIRYQTGQAASSHYWDALTYGSLPSQFTFSSESGYNNNQYVMRATVTLSN